MTDKPQACFDMGCPLATKGKGFVLGSGDPRTAKMAFILEAPGRDETEFMLAPMHGRDFLSTVAEVDAEIARRKRDYPELSDKFLRFSAPVVGKSGSLLNSWVLPQAGVKRADLFIDNVLRCLPPKSKGGAAYPTGEDRKAAEKCCRHWDRIGDFKPDTLVVTMHPAAIMREVTPLSLMIKDIEKARDFAEQGRRVAVLLGGKALKAYLRFSENVTKLRGSYMNLQPEWASTYKMLFEYAAKARKAKKAPPVRPETLTETPCKSAKRYKGKRPPKCMCVSCWTKYEVNQDASFI